MELDEELFARCSYRFVNAGSCHEKQDALFGSERLEKLGICFVRDFGFRKPEVLDFTL